MERVGAEVERELARFGAAGSMAAIVRAWPGAVGDAIARNAWPARVGRDGTLHVTASSAAWAFELAQLSATVLEGLRRELGESAPARLRFAVGPIPSRAEEEARPPSPPPEAARRVAETLVAEIDNAELRELVAKAAAASLAKAAADRGFW